MFVDQAASPKFLIIATVPLSVEVSVDPFVFKSSAPPSFHSLFGSYHLPPGVLITTLFPATTETEFLPPGLIVLPFFLTR